VRFTIESTNSKQFPTILSSASIEIRDTRKRPGLEER
jgi:hypothetical protein